MGIAKGSNWNGWMIYETRIAQAMKSRDIHNLKHNTRDISLRYLYAFDGFVSLAYLDKR